MTAILDTSFLFALTDQSDRNHQRVLAVAQSVKRLSAAAYLGGWVAILSDVKDDPATLPWLKQAFQVAQQEWVRRMVALVIDRIYPNDLDEQMQKSIEFTPITSTSKCKNGYSPMSNRGKSPYNYT